MATAMAMDDTPGGWARVLYSGMMKSISPLLFLNLQYRRWQGGEQYFRWRERMGYPSRERPSGLLIWFHAVSVGEGISAIPVILRCREARPLITILMTTSTAAAHSVLEQRLPPEVILQFAPVDTPMAVDRFLLHWTPEAAIFMESELWPTLIFKAALRGCVLNMLSTPDFQHQIPLALLNARMSFKSFERWSAPPLQALVAAMLARFSLVAPLWYPYDYKDCRTPPYGIWGGLHMIIVTIERPHELSTKEAIRYQILGASPSVIHFAGNLKYACAVGDAQKKPRFGVVDIETALVDRKVWLAASTHAEEENVIIRIHKELKNWVPHLLTIIVPRQPSRGQIIVTRFQQQGFRVAVRSNGHQISRNIDVYVADTLGELNQFYAMVPIAFVGGSLFQGLAGHNIAEAAAAGCVVLTGYHIGHFQEMAREMQKMSPLSVQQVDEEGLADTLRKFLTDETNLDERRAVVVDALSAAASGVITRVWELLESCILKKGLS